ncbi:MAG: tetratricopeptide repeat protein, partial [Candidatus Eisenbacteria bacterium]|nr:tetratricopeptide repeat protein [Candidatus Eisenbacteria bacterium]
MNGTDSEHAGRTGGVSLRFVALLILLFGASGPTGSAWAQTRQVDAGMPAALTVEYFDAAGNAVRSTNGTLVRQGLVVPLSALAGITEVRALARDGKRWSTEALIALHPESDLALLAISDIPAYAIDVPRSATFTKQSDVFLVRGPGGSGAETVTATVYGKFSIRGPDFLGLSQGVPSGAPGFRSDGALLGICFDLSRDGILLDYLASPASIENLIAGRGEPVSLRDLTPPVLPAYQDPDSLAGLVFRGALLTTTDRPEEAHRFLQRALDRDPTNATAHFWMGKLFFAQGRHEEAADAFRRAADIDPSFHLAWHMAGVAESQAGRYPQALEM